jgi:endonuclease/exonuclease/phosphatase family metal-dependent hydrolase
LIQGGDKINRYMLTTTRRIALLGFCFLILLLVWFFNVSRPGRRAIGRFQGCSSEQIGNRIIRIVSLNMLHGHPDFEYLPQRLGLIAAEIQRLAPDIVLLQEVPWTLKTGNGAEYLAEQAGMNYAYYRANGNKWAIFFEEGEAILSRYPLTHLSFTELKPQADTFEHRVVLHATTLMPTGELDLFVAHLTNGDETVNQAQLDSLRAFVKATATTTAIIAGDFNAGEDEVHMVSLAEEWIDSFRLLHPEEPGYTSSVDDLRAAPGEALEKRIDYIFVRLLGENPVNILKAEVVFDQPFQVGDGWLWASDHAGVMVELEMVGTNK